MYPSEPFYFAHRGGNEWAPENSLESFLKAYEHGCRYLELDVRETKDSDLVVFHDANLSRVLGINCPIAELDASDLGSIRYTNGSPILRFVDLIQNLPSDAFFNIDPKSDRAAGLLTSALVAKGDLLNRVAIGTFSTTRIRWIRSHLPQVATVASRNEVLRAFERFLRGKPLDIQAKALQIPLTPYFRPHLRAEFADYLHEQGLQVHVWTVNSLADMQWLFARGIDAVMTDKPTIATKYFDERQGK